MVQVADGQRAAAQGVRLDADQQQIVERVPHQGAWPVLLLRQREKLRRRVLPLGIIGPEASGAVDTCNQHAVDDHHFLALAGDPQLVHRGISQAVQIHAPGAADVHPLPIGGHGHAKLRGGSCSGVDEVHGLDRAGGELVVDHGLRVVIGRDDRAVEVPHAPSNDAVRIGEYDVLAGGGVVAPQPAAIEVDLPADLEEVRAPLGLGAHGELHRIVRQREHREPAILGGSLRPDIEPLANHREVAGRRVSGERGRQEGAALAGAPVDHEDTGGAGVTTTGQVTPRADEDIPVGD